MEKSKIPSLLRPPRLSFDFSKISTNNIENVRPTTAGSNDVQITQLMDTENRVLQQKTMLLQNSLNNSNNNTSAQYIPDASDSVGDFDGCAEPIEARI